MTKINKQKQHMEMFISLLLSLDIREFLINPFPMLRACLKTDLVASTAIIFVSDKFFLRKDKMIELKIKSDNFKFK